MNDVFFGTDGTRDSQSVGRYQWVDRTARGQGMQVHHTILDETSEWSSEKIIEAMKAMGVAAHEAATSMDGVSAAFAKSLSQTKKTWILDEGEELVARVLGHEYSPEHDWCSCGWLAGESGHTRFSHHARAAIQEAEQELPKPFRPKPHVLEAKRQRDAERQRHSEQLYGRYPSRRASR